MFCCFELYVLDTTAPTVTFSGIASGARISKNGAASLRTLIVTFNEDIKADATLVVTEITETDSGRCRYCGRSSEANQHSGVEYSFDSGRSQAGSSCVLAG